MQSALVKFTSSPMSKKYEEDNNVNGEMHEHCKQCVDKKHGTCEVMSVGEAE